MPLKSRRRYVAFVFDILDGFSLGMSGGGTSRFVPPRTSGGKHRSEEKGGAGKEFFSSEGELFEAKSSSVYRWDLCSDPSFRQRGGQNDHSSKKTDEPKH
jgi:hypothetical protein